MILVVLLSFDNRCAAAEDATIHYDLGISYFKEGLYDQAIVEFKKAIEIDPNMAVAYMDLGRVYGRLKEYDKAIYYMELSLKANEDIAEKVLPNLIFIYLLKNDVKAATYLKKLLKINPPLGSYLAKLVFNARIYGIKERDGELVVEHLFFDSSTSRVLEVVKKADVFIESGEFDKAISIYDAFIKKENLTPKEKAAILHTIGMLYSVEQNKPQEGLPYLEQAVELDPGEVAFRIGLIDAYRSLQEYSKALDEINAMLAQDPDNKYGLYFKGVIYFKRGEWKKAIENWDKLEKVDKILFALLEAEYNKAANMVSTMP